MKWLLFVFSSILLYLSVLLWINSGFHYKEEVFNVREIKGSWLRNDSGDIVRLAGITVPYEKEPNFREMMKIAIEKELLNKEVKLRYIAKPQEKYDGYPEIPLAEVYVNGININEYLIKNGYAFFSFDPIWRVNKYYRMEKIAKSNRKGVWSAKPSPEVLFITRETWSNVHYPECEEVRKLKMKSCLEYYVEYPSNVRGKSISRTCSFCKKARNRLGYSKRRNPFNEDEWHVYSKNDLEKLQVLLSKDIRAKRTIRLNE